MPTVRSIRFVTQPISVDALGRGVGGQNGARRAQLVKLLEHPLLQLYLLRHCFDDYVCFPGSNGQVCGDPDPPHGSLGVRRLQLAQMHALFQVAPDGTDSPTQQFLIDVHEGYLISPKGTDMGDASPHQTGPKDHNPADSRIHVHSLFSLHHGIPAVTAAGHLAGKSRIRSSRCNRRGRTSAA